MIFLTETKCKIRFTYVGFNCKKTLRANFMANYGQKIRSDLHQQLRPLTANILIIRTPPLVAKPFFLQILVGLCDEESEFGTKVYN